ncbi:hypothetical protein [Allokutzneria sp. NRRL B-24872]|uniref:hypothetical protein n=1 Tax=Allokutzneria sp. NRRL B-24872 TaxID=1137961 RepID=UPI000A36A94B|nr:hypothetical protein [Allokutzneria sp. NRRL B-24872]
MIIADAGSARLHHKSDSHWVMRVGELEFRIEHDPDVPPPMWALRDTLLCHGFHPYPSDLRAWELAPETTAIRVVRDPESLPRSEKPVTHRVVYPAAPRSRSLRSRRR